MSGEGNKPEGVYRELVTGCPPTPARGGAVSVRLWERRVAGRGRARLPARAVERLVAVAHRRLEARLRRARLECKSLWRMPRDPVEDRSEGLRRVQALGVERLVHELLHHHELVHGHARDPLHERLEAGVELV